MKPTFLIEGDSGDLWCTLEGVRIAASGTLEIKFEVINGRWEGVLWPSLRTLRVEMTRKECNAEIVWVGQAPFSDGQYNEAISWIRDQVQRGINDPTSSTGTNIKLASILAKGRESLPGYQNPVTKLDSRAVRTDTVDQGASVKPFTLYPLGPTEGLKPGCSAIAKAIDAAIATLAYGGTPDTEALAALGLKLAIPEADGPNSITITIDFSKPYTELGDDLPF